MESDNPVIKLTGETKWSRTTKTVLCKNKAWHTPANTKINYKLRLMRQYVKKFKKKGSECFIGISIVEEDKEEHLWLSKHNKFSLNHLPLFNSFSFFFFWIMDSKLWFHPLAPAWVAGADPGCRGQSQSCLRLRLQEVRLHVRFHPSSAPSTHTTSPRVQPKYLFLVCAFNIWF